MSRVDHIKYPLYTEVALKIFNAAILNWSSEHNRTYLAHNTLALFDEKIAPAHDLVIVNTGYYARREQKPEMIAWAIKELLVNGCFYKEDPNARSECYRFNPIMDDERKKLRDIVLDKTKNVQLIVKAYDMEYNKYSNGMRRSGYDYHRINSRDAWIIYDYILNHRKSTMEKQYGTAEIERIIGTPNDPMKIEQLKLHTEEVAKIKTDCETECKDLEAKMYAEQRAIRAKYEQLMNERRTKCQEDLAKIDKEFEELMAMSALLTEGATEDTASKAI